MDVKGFLVSILDKIFNPVTTFLNLAIDKVNGVSLVAIQGLNVQQYLSVFGDMPHEWQLLIKTIMTSVVILGTIYIFRSVMRIYYAVKEAIPFIN